MTYLKYGTFLDVGQGNNLWQSVDAEHVRIRLTIGDDGGHGLHHLCHVAAMPSGQMSTIYECLDGCNRIRSVKRQKVLYSGKCSVR